MGFLFNNLLYIVLSHCLKQCNFYYKFWYSVEQSPLSCVVFIVVRTFNVISSLWQILSVQYTIVNCRLIDYSKPLELTPCAQVTLYTHWTTLHVPSAAPGSPRPPVCLSACLSVTILDISQKGNHTVVCLWLTYFT